MFATRSTARVMRAGLWVAAAIIVVRILLEQLGSPESINNIFGVAWLYLVIPVLFALRIAAAGEAGPFKSLLQSLLIFAVYTRLMVLVTYMLAYRLRWEAPRFSLSLGGNVGPEIGFVEGFIWIPVRNAMIWIVLTTVVGMIIGAITLLIKRRRSGSTVSQRG